MREAKSVCVCARASKCGCIDGTPQREYFLALILGSTGFISKGYTRQTIRVSPVVKRGSIRRTIKPNPPKSFQWGILRMQHSFSLFDHRFFVNCAQSKVCVSTIQCVFYKVFLARLQLKRIMLYTFPIPKNVQCVYSLYASFDVIERKIRKKD